MGWYETVKDAVYLALCATFQMDPESREALSRFIPAYEEDTTTPQAPRDKNVCYYAISIEQGTTFDYFTPVYDIKDGVPTVFIKKPIPVSVLFTFYGPNADDDAEAFWSLSMWDFGGPKSPRGILRKHDILPRGALPRPTAIFETEGTYQRRRCDVRMGLTYCDVYERASETVEHPPEIELVPYHNN